MSWVLGRRREPARLRLVCFAHAGGGASEFARWAAALPDDVDVCPIQLPGHQTRLAEPPVDEWPGLLDAVEEGTAPLADRPWVLFGHSFGSLVAFELARRLEWRGHGPRHVVVAGCHAPEALPPGEDVRRLDDDALVAMIARRTGDDGVLSDPELRALVLPALRTDMTLVSTYRADGVRGSLRCPVTVLGAHDDTWPRPDELAGWHDVTTGPSTVHLLDGGHFFPATRREQVLGLIGDVLAGAGAAPGPP